MARNSHDGARSVADQDVVRDPDRDLLLINWIDGVSTRENPSFLFGQVSAFEIGFSGDLLPVFNYLRPLSRSCHPIDQRMFRRQHDVSRAEKRVRAGGKNRDRVVQTIDSKCRLCAFAPADPISLQNFNRLWPIQRVEFRQQLASTQDALRHEIVDGAQRAVYEVREEMAAGIGSARKEIPQEVAASSRETQEIMRAEIKELRSGLQSELARMHESLRSEIAHKTESAAKQLSGEIKSGQKSLTALSKKFERFDDRVSVQVKDQEQRLRKIERRARG